MLNFVHQCRRTGCTGPPRGRLRRFFFPGVPVEAVTFTPTWMRPLAQLPSNTDCPFHCKTHPRVLRSGAYFQSCWASKMTSQMMVQSAVMLQAMSRMYHKPARFFSHRLFLNLFFGSSQTEHWLPKYGHFKFGWVGAFKNLVYSCFARGLHSWIGFTHGLHAPKKHVSCILCVNHVQT